ncbi:hypothetical protein Tco_0227527 [Tanacetum coccineum]
MLCTYLKNMEGKKLKDLKKFFFDSIQKMFDKDFKRVNTFVDFRTHLVEDSSKRVGEELEQELLSLTTIVDWKIHKKGKKSYYQIVRADGKSQMYLVFSHMLKSFDREDLEDLYKLVKARYGSTRPVEDLDLVLWNDLKNMFEPHVKDEIWKLQQRKLMILKKNIKFRGGLLGLKVFLMLFGVTAALINVNVAQSKFLNQKGSGGGSGVKEKSLNRNPMNTSLGIGVSTKSNDTMNEETPVDVASVVKEGVIPL